MFNLCDNNLGSRKVKGVDGYCFPTVSNSPENLTMENNVDY